LKFDGFKYIQYLHDYSFLKEIKKDLFKNRINNAATLLLDVTEDYFSKYLDISDS
jgi:hypothetical protein